MLKLKDVFRQTARNTDPYITGGKYECILVNGERGFLVTNADIGSYHLISRRLYVHVTCQVCHNALKIILFLIRVDDYAKSTCKAC